MTKKQIVPTLRQNILKFESQELKLRSHIFFYEMNVTHSKMEINNLL